MINFHLGVPNQFGCFTYCRPFPCGFRGKRFVGVPKGDVSFINQYFCRNKFGEEFKPSVLSSKKSDKYIFNRYLVINPALIGLRVSVYQGVRFHSFRIRALFVGAALGDFIRTYKFSPNIGLKKRHGYFGTRLKKSGKVIK